MPDNQHQPIEFSDEDFLPNANATTQPHDLKNRGDRALGHPAVKHSGVTRRGWLTVVGGWIAAGIGGLVCAAVGSLTKRGKNIGRSQQARKPIVSISPRVAQPVIQKTQDWLHEPRKEDEEKRKNPLRRSDNPGGW